MVEVSSVQALAVGRQDLNSLVDKTLILSSIYCCRSSESWRWDDGRKVSRGGLPALILYKVYFSGLVTESLTVTQPGLVQVKIK